MKQVRKTWVRPAAVLAGIALLALPAWGQGQAVDGERVRGYVPPPTELKLVGDHWTPYDPPAPPEGKEVYIIQKGDTLWDLAGRFYDDNYLWPVIWDANRYITYSHWIYPGDPLVIPPRPGVVGEQGLAEVETTPPEQVAEQPPPPPPPAPTGPVLVAAAEQEELICIPQLVERFDPGPLAIIGSDEPRRQLNSPGDILFLSAGQDFGIEPGAEYVVVRSGGTISDPATGEPAAIYMQRLGKIRVIAVQQNSATAEISYACDAIEIGDHLLPYRESPVPMIERVPLAKLASPTPGPLNGSVVVTLHPEATIAGAGDLVGIDLSAKAGVTAGDRILFWRDAGPRLPRKVVAQGVVLSANGAGSTVKIIESWQEVRLGDSAELL